MVYMVASFIMMVLAVISCHFDELAMTILLIGIAIWNVLLGILVKRD